MKIRRYTCKDMQEALLKVKMDLGSEAVIMNSKKVRRKGLAGLFSKPMIEVVAAIDDDYVRPSRPSYPLRQASAMPAVSHAPASYAHPVTNEPPVTVNQSKEPSKAPENTENRNDKKIVDLENKIKSMETMLEQIFKAVNSQEKPADERPKQDDALSDLKPQGEGNLDFIKNLLYKQDVEPKLIEKILEKIRERGGQNLKPDEVLNLTGRIMTVLLGEPEPIVLNESKKPHVAIFIGPTGVGKTTTLAKIAADFTLNKKKKVGLITADTYRIAAVEQLKTYAEILNLQVSVVYSPNEIKSAIEELSRNDLILIDTAGRSHRNKTHFDELKMLVNYAAADETYLVISCNTGKPAMREILEYYAFIRNYKLLFTKLDESPAPGVILNARYMTGKPLSYTTAGQSVPDDLEIADTKQLVASILEAGNG